jgi:hypothetical protein
LLRVEFIFNPESGEKGGIFARIVADLFSQRLKISVEQSRAIMALLFIC